MGDRGSRISGDSGDSGDSGCSGCSGAFPPRSPIIDLPSPIPDLPSPILVPPSTFHLPRFTKMNDYLYNENINLSALITAQPQLLLTLSHFGIPMGFGDKTIAQVCAEHGVDPQFFLLICEVYSHDSYIPSLATIKSTPMQGLVPYLLRSHDYYLNRRLPHIAHHLEKIASMLPSRAGKAIKQFFNAYVEEVREHFVHEETTVYPHISHLLSGNQRDKFKIKDFLASHGNLDDKLSDLVQIIFKYLPGSKNSPSKIEGAGGSMTSSLPGSKNSPSKIEGVGGSMTGDSNDDAIDMIFDILQLSLDLRKHALIEDKILGPYVKLLEKSSQR